MTRPIDPPRPPVSVAAFAARSRSRGGRLQLIGQQPSTGSSSDSASTSGDSQRAGHGPDTRRGQRRGRSPSGKKDGSLAEALAAVGAKVVWTGTAGPFAPAAQEMAANELDYRPGLDHLGDHRAGGHPGVQALRQHAPDRIGEGILVPASSPITSRQGPGRQDGRRQQGRHRRVPAAQGAGRGRTSPRRRSPSSTSTPAQTAPVLNSGKVDAWATWTSVLGRGGRPGQRPLRRHRRPDRLGELLGLGRAQRLRAASTRRSWPRSTSTCTTRAEAGRRTRPSFINVFTTAGPEALNPAEIAFDAKDIEPRSAPPNRSARRRRPQFQNVANFFASAGVTKSVVSVAPTSSRPGTRRMTADTGRRVLPGPGHPAASAAEAAAARGVRQRSGSPARSRCSAAWWAAAPAGR